MAINYILVDFSSNQKSFFIVSIDDREDREDIKKN